jgi:hypothetical protein
LTARIGAEAAAKAASLARITICEACNDRRQKQRLFIGICADKIRMPQSA